MIFRKFFENRPATNCYQNERSPIKSRTAIKALFSALWKTAGVSQLFTQNSVESPSSFVLCKIKTKDKGQKTKDEKQ